MALREMEFDPNLESAGDVRRFVEEGLTGYTRLDDVLLAASELATNVILHARTPFGVRLSSDHSLVRIEVSDGSSIVPAIKNMAARHWGIRIIEAVSDRWGIESTVTGKTVWVEFIS